MQVFFHVKSFFVAMKMFLSSVGEPLISTQIRKHVLEALGRDLCRALLQRRRETLAREVAVFYSTVELLISPKPVLSNKDEYWGGAHRDLLESISQGRRVLWRRIGAGVSTGQYCWAQVLSCRLHEVAADHGDESSRGPGGVARPLCRGGCGA
jgi:hypothetical protein